MVPFPSSFDFGKWDDWWKYIRPVSDCDIGKRALSMLGRESDYNVILDNCHQFCAGCITGDFDNAINFFFFLEDLIKQEVDLGSSIVWLEWDWENNQLIRRNPLL